MKLNKQQLQEIIKESISSYLNEISIDTIDSAMQKAAEKTNLYGWGDPRGLRKQWQAKNFKKNRDERLGFDPDEVKKTIQAKGTTDDEKTDRDWGRFEQNRRDRRNGKRTYSPERGRWITNMNESVQNAVAQAMGKYLKGEIDSKRANKAIMDLANSSPKKGKK